jgi:hypothetical protein
MTFRRILLIGLLLSILFMVVPAVSAQSSSLEDIQFSDIIDALKPREGDQLLLDILLYLIFFVGLITTFLVPDKQLTVQLLIFLTLLLSVVAKLLVGTHRSAIFGPCDIAVLVINVIMFVAPLIAAGMLRPVKGKRSKAMLPAIILGLLGGGYFFMFWNFEQRGGACENAGQALPGAIQTLEYMHSFVINLMIA